jgi:FkbM family methyltransferase
MVSISAFKRAAIRAAEAVHPTFHVNTARGRVRVPKANRAVASILDWSPDWKASLFGRVLKDRPGLFVDVGANLGQTLLDYCSTSSEHGYLGFEPNPTGAAFIATIIRENDLADCRLIPAGLSASNSVAELFFEYDWIADPSATMMGDLRPGRHYRSHFISCFRFDDLAASLVTGPLSLIKIDVEGAELLALQGMLNTIVERKPWILCEVLRRDSKEALEPFRVRTGTLKKLLDTVGFEIYNVRRTADSRSVAGLDRVAAFPEDVFSAANRDGNDYLFVPAGPMWGV